jgi:hypothetical protein
LVILAEEFWGIARTTVVDWGAVQVHQTEPPDVNDPGKEVLFSALSSVAPASVPVKAIEEPVRTVRSLKLSFGGGAWPRAPAIEASIIAVKRQNWRVLIVVERERTKEQQSWCQKGAER